MKKVLSLVLTVCMLLSVCGAMTVSAASEEPTYIYLSYEKGRVGSTVDVTIRIAEPAYDGLACLVFSPNFDKSVMTLETVNSNLPCGTFLYNEDSQNPKFIWYNTENYSPDSSAAAFTMTFRINEEAEDGYYPITLDYNANDICTATGDLVVLQVEAGQMYIFHYLKGDTDNDLSISGADVVYLARYLVDLETEISEIGADVNEDGSIDGRDLIKLSRHIVGMEIIPDIVY